MDSDGGLRATQHGGEPDGGVVQGFRCWANVDGRGALDSLDGVKADGAKRPCEQNFICRPPTMCRPLLWSLFYALLGFFC